MSIGTCAISSFCSLERRFVCAHFLALYVYIMCQQLVHTYTLCLCVRICDEELPTSRNGTGLVGCKLLCTLCTFLSTNRVRTQFDELNFVSNATGRTTNRSNVQTSIGTNLSEHQTFLFNLHACSYIHKNVSMPSRINQQKTYKHKHAHARTCFGRRLCCDCRRWRRSPTRHRGAAATRFECLTHVTANLQSNPPKTNLKLNCPSSKRTSS